MTTKSIRMRSTEVGADGEPLEAGIVYELNALSADHWLKREKADLVEDATTRPTSKKLTVAEVEAAQAAADAKAADEARVAAQIQAEADAKLAAEAEAQDLAIAEAARLAEAQAEADAKTRQAADDAAAAAAPRTNGGKKK